VRIEEGGDEESVSLKMAASQYEGVGGYMYGGMCGRGVGPVEGRSKGKGQSNAGGQESVGLVFENELFYFALNRFHTLLHQQQPAF
jgi:hypothetical protein